MVSKASEDLPEPERPVSTVSVSRGISTSTFLRLCSRAPRMEMFFSKVHAFSVRLAHGQETLVFQGRCGGNAIGRSWRSRLPPMHRPNPKVRPHRAEVR